MNTGRYWSIKLKTNVDLYKPQHSDVCMDCGKFCSNPIAFVREDDEDGLEYIYGKECIKKYKLVEIG